MMVVHLRGHTQKKLDALFTCFGGDIACIIAKTAWGGLHTFMQHSGLSAEAIQLWVRTLSVYSCLRMSSARNLELELVHFLCPFCPRLRHRVGVGLKIRTGCISCFILRTSTCSALAFASLGARGDLGRLWMSPSFSVQLPTSCEPQKLLRD